jgi:hypothetical protein
MKFRKKPVEVEAYRIRGVGQAFGTIEAPPPWLMAALENGTVVPREEGGADIATPEGHMKAKHSDWIIRGVRGEIYPCADEIFQLTYEPVEP